MISLKYLFLLVIVKLCYNNSDNSQKGIEFLYKQKFSLAEKFVDLQFLVPFPRLDIQIHQQPSNESSPIQFKTPDSQINESVSPNSTDSSFGSPTTVNQ